MPDQITLSDAAQALLHRRFQRERVEVTDETRPLYWELVRAGLMIPLHTFALGPNSAFRLTEAACDMRDGVNVPSSPIPSLEAGPSPHD